MAAYNIEQIKDKKKLVKLANYGTAERRNMRPKVLIGAGKEKPFIEGDILDANATLNLIEDTYDKGRIFRSFSKEGKKIDKEIKELLEKTDENYEQLSSAIADNKEDADQKIDQLSSKVDNIESNIPNLRRVVDIQLQSVLDGTKTYLVTKQGDVQEQIQISDGEKGEQGEKGDPFTYEDFTPEQIEGLKVKGDRGISISSLEQTQTAYTSGGVNEFTVTLDDGTVSKWYVRNGQKGDATKIWVNANTVHSGYYDSDNHEIKLLNADGDIMSVIDATVFIKDGMISDAYVEDGYIVIIFNTDAGQTPIMIPVTDIFDADDYYTKLDTDTRIAEDVLVETQRAEAAELQLTDDLAQEVSDRLSGDTTLDTKIETETTRATTAEGLLGQRVTSNSAAILTETTRATNAEEALSDAIDAEESTRIQEIDDLQDLLDAYIQSNNAAVQAEITRATTAEGVLQDNIDAEETRAATAEQTNATAIATETSRAQSAELALLGAINTEASTRAAAITAEETRATTVEQALQDNIDAEEQRAIAAELDLQDAIDAVEQGAGQGITEVQQALNDEITRATGAESQLSSDLSAEITRATNADNANTTAISNEVARATLSEQQNAADIDAVEALIPSQATSENQLADKAFVNSSIATSTATFVGTFNSITDLYAVTTADVNDYGYVVTTDSVGNTKYNRYKYDGSQWNFEYSLNNSSFTAEEWASIQSGMTQALREKLENLPSSATTSIGISVPTGFTVTGSPITSSGTIAINFENGYSIPTIASQTNWDTAYGWGNHANANYVKSVKVGTTAYNPSSGIVSLPAYPTTLPASDVYSWAKASTKPSYTLDEVSDGSTRKLANYLPLSGGTMTGGINFSIAGSNRNAVAFRKSVYEQQFGWGWDLFDGAGLGLYNSDASGTEKGCFYLYTSNGSNHVFLHGRPDGTLMWNGESLYHTGNLTNISQLTNDAGYITSSGSITGNAATASTGNTLLINGTTTEDSCVPAAERVACYYSNPCTASTSDAFILAFNTNNYVAQLAIDVDRTNKMAVRMKTPSQTWTSWASIITSDSIGSQSVNYAASAGSAATINTNNATLSTGIESNPIYCYNGGTVDGGTYNVFGAHGAPSSLSFTWYATHWHLGNIRGGSSDSVGFGIMYDSPTTYTFVVTPNDGCFYQGMKLPDVNGNIASATKLQTARTLWGNSFDGSADVNETMYFPDHMTLINVGPSSWPYRKVLATGWNNTVQDYVDICVPGANNNSNPLRYTSGGKLGIGTTSPSYTLDVNGETHINGNLRFQTGSSGMYGIVPLTTSGWTLNLCTEGQPRITIKDEGNVGIGTTSPLHKLDVNGDAMFANSIITGNSVYIQYYLLMKDGSGNWISTIDRSGNSPIFGYGHGQNGYHVYYTGRTVSINAGTSWSNTSNGIYIDSSNNVGVGTDTPLYKLHVNGDAAATNFYTTSDSSKKDNITSLSEHIRKFTLKETGKEHYGVIAQEVEEMFREGEEGSYTVNYNSILSYYVGLLENRVAELENKVKELSHG